MMYTIICNKINCGSGIDSSSNKFVFLDAMYIFFVIVIWLQGDDFIEPH